MRFLAAEPPGHTRPFRLTTLTAGIYLGPDRRIWVVLSAVTGLFMALAVAVGSATVSSHSSISLWSIPVTMGMTLMFWAIMWIMFVKTHEWYDRKYSPQEYRLAKDRRGYDMLRGGEVLAQRRQRLVDDDTDQPIVQPHHVPAAWEEQWRLERELRTKQEALLRELGSI